jgi:hypothetical protein
VVTRADANIFLRILAPFLPAYIGGRPSTSLVASCVRRHALPWGPVCLRRESRAEEPRIAVLYSNRSGEITKDGSRCVGIEKLITTKRSHAPGFSLR